LVHWCNVRPVDGGVVTSLSAVVRNTEERASVLSCVGVVLSEIALLTVGPIDDTITTVWETAVQSACIGAVSVVGTGITVFEIVLDSITANRESAVKSAFIWGISIESTIIALLTSVEESVTTLVTAHWVASVTFSSVTVIALFVGVSDSITALWNTANGSASISSVGTSSSSITLLSKIDDTVSTLWSGTISSTSVREIGIVTSVITLLSWVGSSVTTELSTVGGTVDVGVVGMTNPWVNDLNRVALFTVKVIDNTISATSVETVSTTDSVRRIRVE